MGRLENMLKNLLVLGRDHPLPVGSRRARKTGLSFENLEERLVLSTFQAIPIVQGPGTFSGPGGREGFGSGGDGEFEGGHGGSSSSTLNQDARLVRQALQTFNASYQSATAALRLTATSTQGPTAAGLLAFDNSIATAVQTLNTAIGTDLANLTNTGAGLVTTIDGYTATLQTEIDSAATGLANSTNSAVRSMNREVSRYLYTAANQSNTAILNDAPATSLTPAVLRTFNQAVQSAYRAFNTTLGNALQTAITAGAKLDGTVVSTATATLQTALTSAVSSLPTGFTTSTYNPTSTIATDLTNLDTALTAVAAPTTGNRASIRLFLRTVSMALSQNLSPINMAFWTAFNHYNNSLL